MKRKKNVTPAPSLTQKFKEMPALQKRRLIIKSVVGLGVFGVAAGAISGYDQKKRALHDLSVIGAGKPVVVQIHDTSCPICRQLKSRTSKVLEDQDAVEYRIADILTEEGRTLAQKYSVQKTTLLFFDAKGKHLDTVFGLQTIEQIEDRIARNFAPPA